jgi:CheY-like chemotaxis protein
MLGSSSTSCGILLVEGDWKDSVLRALETRLLAEDPQLKVQFLYDRDLGILTLLLEGEKLAKTHFVSLQAKPFLQQIRKRNVRMAVSAFPGYASPTEQELWRMLQMLLAGGDAAEKDIMIYAGRKMEKKAPTILIIDVDETVPQFLNPRLELQGYDVHNACDGLEGIRLCSELLPDVVITELSLPVYDGYQVIRSIRKNNELDSRIMVLSDRRLEHDIRLCFQLGADDFIRKPYSPVELEARLKRLLSS